MGDQAKNFVGKAQDARCRPISGGKGRCTDQTSGWPSPNPDYKYIIWTFFTS